MSGEPDVDVKPWGRRANLQCISPELALKPSGNCAVSCPQIGEQQTWLAQGEFFGSCRVGPGVSPEPLTDPDVNLSIHPPRVTARRLPPSAELLGSSRYDPVGPSQRR